MRRLILAVGLVLLAASVLPAQVVPKGNVFIGYSYMRVSPNVGNDFGLNGWNASLEGKVLPFVGLVVDMSGHYGNFVIVCQVNPGCPPNQPNDRLYNVLLGPRLSFSVHGVRPFAHALFGAAHESQTLAGSTATDNSFATAIGGGADFKLAPILGWRVQLDGLRTSLFGSSHVNLRASTGIVLRF